MSIQSGAVPKRQSNPPANCIPEAIWAASPTTTRGSPTPLSSDGKGERIAYASNRSIFVRSIDRPAEAKQYTQHTAATTVARFSPSGFYIASGDVSGQVRVWDAQGAEKTRGEYPIIAGRINDIAWDGDSQRIIAVGDGRERFGHCITADSGNSVGEISGHSAAINCVAVRPRRPLRAATGGDDTSLCFLHGVPFKFHTSKRDTHQRFIYGTQFSPDGATLVSVGADRRIWLYDGVTGEAQHQIGEGVHTGSIFGVSWAPDSRRLATCSADQTVKLWDVETGACTQSWRRGDDDDDDGVVRVAHQQLGVTWPGGRADGLVISVDLEGRLNYFEPRSAQPVRVVRGHQKAITAAALDAEAHTLITGSSDGRVRAWDVATGAADEVIGAAHGSYVTGMAAPAPPESRVYSVGWDDRLWGIDCATRACVGAPVPMPGQPRAVATTSVDGRAFVLVATPEGIQVLSGSETISTHALPAPTCLAAAAHVIAAGTAAHGLHVFHLSATGTLTPQDA